MDYLNSIYYNSLPHEVQEMVTNSGINFENEEEINMFLKNSGPIPSASLFPLYEYPFFW